MDGKYEETFGDIVSFVEARYRVIAKKSGRAIAGLSMGGFHSLHISRYYPDMFDYIGLFSAAIMSDPKMTSKVYMNFDTSLARQKKNGYTSFLYLILTGVVSATRFL